MGFVIALASATVLAIVVKLYLTNKGTQVQR